MPALVDPNKNISGKQATLMFELAASAYRQNSFGRRVTSEALSFAVELRLGLRLRMRVDYRPVAHACYSHQRSCYSCWSGRLSAKRSCDQAILSGTHWNRAESPLYWTDRILPLQPFTETGANRRR